MGMYDYVICRYPLPTLPPAFVKSGDHQYQSKSLDCQMALYEIRDNGTLWLEDYDIEDQSDLAKWKTAHPGEELPKDPRRVFRPRPRRRRPPRDTARFPRYRESGWS
jgi:hypothetical protein